MNDTTLVLSLAAAIVAGTPLVFAGVGELITQRSGVMNLGVEGMMLIGGICAFWTHQVYDDPVLGLAVGMLGGAALASVHATLTIGLRANQIVSGLALVMVGQGLSRYLSESVDPRLSTRRLPSRIEPIADGGIADWPVVGPILFGHDILVYVSWLLAAATSFYLFRTRAGLATRATGEDPASADAAGIEVNQRRYAHTLIGGALAGLGGSYLTLASIGQWQEDITAGAGWIAFSLVIVAQWRPWRLVIGAYLFGGLIRLSFTLRLLGLDVPGSFLNMMPFIGAVLALTIISARERPSGTAAPAALAQPYVREAR